MNNDGKLDDWLDALSKPIVRGGPSKTKANAAGATARRISVKVSNDSKRETSADDELMRRMEALMDRAPVASHSSIKVDEQSCNPINGANSGVEAVDTLLMAVQDDVRLDKVGQDHANEVQKDFMARLEALKSTSPEKHQDQLPRSELQDFTVRLATLKSSSDDSKPLVSIEKTKEASESEIDTLLRAVQDEVDLERSTLDDTDSFEQDMANRLAKLKENTVTSIKKAQNIGTNSTAIRRLDRPPEGLDAEELEQMNWCCICNDDATWQCLDEECDQDVYCDPCWQRSHDKASGYSSHRKKRLT